MSIRWIKACLLTAVCIGMVGLSGGDLFAFGGKLFGGSSCPAPCASSCAPTTQYVQTWVEETVSVMKPTWVTETYTAHKWECVPETVTKQVTVMKSVTETVMVNKSVTEKVPVTKTVTVTEKVPVTETVTVMQKVPVSKQVTVNETRYRT